MSARASTGLAVCGYVSIGLCSDGARVDIFVYLWAAVGGTEQLGRAQSAVLFQGVYIPLRLNEFSYQSSIMIVY